MQYVLSTMSLQSSVFSEGRVKVMQSRTLYIWHYLDNSESQSLLIVTTDH